MTAPEELHGQDEGSILVESHLGPTQNILDQPPFTWLRENTDILPPDFFLNPEEGFVVYVARLVPKVALWEVKRVLSEKHRDQAMSRVHTGEMWLATNFPMAHEYLYANWQRRCGYDNKGNRLTRGFSPPPALSYAAYRVREERQKDQARWVGLAALLPGLETAEDIGAAMPAKGKVNVYFRLFRSGAIDIA